MTFIPDTHELAWAAGFFDGEGTCSSKTYQEAGKMKTVIRLHVGQNDRRPLDRFREAMGGIGVVYGPYRQVRTWHDGVTRGNEFYRYEINGFEPAQAVLAMMWPFLSQPKREQGARVLVYRQEMRLKYPIRRYTKKPDRVWLNQERTRPDRRRVAVRAAHGADYSDYFPVGGPIK